jgi:pterin-4a-carbinolamine dehydratase
MLSQLPRQTSRLLRHGVVDIRVVNTGHMTPKPGLLLRASHRCMHRSSTNPVRISGDRKSITLHLANGDTVTQQFAPTPKISSEKLERALAPLLSGPENDQSTLTTRSWELDPQGDAIHRHFVFSSKQALENAVEQIMQAADDMKHHPHVARGGGDGGGHSSMGNLHCVTITCTTHQPTGLSGKDARLAAKIDEISDQFEKDLATSLETARDEQLVHQVREEQSRLIQINRDAITEALKSCGCSVAKPESHR